MIPTFGAERLVDVDEYQRKKCRKNNKAHNIIFAINIAWYFLLQHLLYF
jgi:predicted transposase YbfD/YdcC